MAAAKVEEKVPQLRNFTGGDLLALVNEKKDVPLVCLKSLVPITGWSFKRTTEVKDGKPATRTFVAFRCDLGCKPHQRDPYMIEIPVHWGDSFLEVQTFAVPEEPIYKLVNQSIGKQLVSTTVELTYGERWRYWTKAIRSAIEKARKKPVPLP